MDRERHMQDLLNEYEVAKLYHDNLMSKAGVQLRLMKSILKEMQDLEGDEIR